MEVEEAHTPMTLFLLLGAMEVVDPAEGPE